METKMGAGVARRLSAVVSSLALVVAGLGAFAVLPAAASSGTDTRQISVDGTATISDGAAATDSGGAQGPGIADGLDSGDTGGPAGASPANRSQSHGVSGEGTSISESGREATDTSQVLSFDGLNHFAQRFGASPNQLSAVEPPDQGLCAGNGFVLETVNDVMAVYSTNGSHLKGPSTLNSFYHYAAAIVRGTPATPTTPAIPTVFGPLLLDPSCYFDSATQRWFHVVLTLDTFSNNGRFTGTNHLDLAVSRTADPRGDWNVYQIPAQDDDRTPGTPDHGCSTGPYPFNPTNPNACIGDYPHIGADANGFYITTNEYSFFRPEFRAAQIYAFSKQALASGAATVSVTQLDTKNMVRGNQAGFTVWPAEVPNGQFNTSDNGTEYFLSSNAADEVNPLKNQTSRDLVVWSLTNTQSLGSSPAIKLTNTVLKVGRYAAPPTATQKAGPTPLADCLNDTLLPFTPPQVTPALFGCWRFIGIPEPAHNQVESQSIDTNDTRMQQVMFADGMLYGALGTAVKVRGKNEAGIEWFEVQPAAEGDAARVAKQGYFGAVDANVSYPALAVNENGVGAMAFTLSGPNDYPSAAYTSFDAKLGTGDIHIAGVGLGPDDGSTAYGAAFGSGPRTRWGDYGAAVVDGSKLWLASEYIGQTCDFTTFLSTLFRCSNSRTQLGNWGTRITELAIGD